MKTQPILRIVEAERLRDGVIITFDDGKCAFFSAALLRRTLPDATSLDDLKLED